MADFIPLVTNEYRLAFIAATSSLPNDVKEVIYKKVLYEGRSSSPPPAPKKITPSPRLERLMKGWKSRRNLY